MDSIYVFHICPVCYHATEVAQESHDHPMMCCDPGSPGHERRKPILDQGGQVRTRAPRWFLEEMGWISKGTA